MFFTDKKFIKIWELNENKISVCLLVYLNIGNEIFSYFIEKYLKLMEETSYNTYIVLSQMNVFFKIFEVL
jgi:hypothetical protein